MNSAPQQMLGEILIEARQESFLRSQLFRAPKHRLVLGVSDQDVVKPFAGGKEGNSGGIQFDADILPRRASNQDYDQVISPLLGLNSGSIARYIDGIQNALNKGGLWFFATIIRGSFQNIAKQHDPEGGVTSFQCMDDLMRRLVVGRMHQPVIDCSRFELHYASEKDAVSDFWYLRGETSRQNISKDTDQCATTCHLEIAFGMVFVKPALRSSMRPIQDDVQFVSK